MSKFSASLSDGPRSFDATITAGGSALDSDDTTTLVPESGVDISLFKRMMRVPSASCPGGGAINSSVKSFIKYDTILTSFTPEQRLAWVMYNSTRGTKVNLKRIGAKPSGYQPGGVFRKDPLKSHKKPPSIGYENPLFCKQTKDPADELIYLWPEYIFTLIQMYIEPAVTAIPRIGQDEGRRSFASSAIPTFLSLWEIEALEVDLYKEILPNISLAMMVYSILLGNIDCLNSANSALAWTQAEDGTYRLNLINIDFGFAGFFGNIIRREPHHGININAVNIFDYILQLVQANPMNYSDNTFLFTIISQAFSHEVGTLAKTLDYFSDEVEKHLTAIIGTANDNVFKSSSSMPILAQELNNFLNSC